MFRIRIFLFTVLSFPAVCSLAQNRVTVKGVVLDDQKRPLSSATVAALWTKDSSQIIAVMADNLGRYALHLSTKGPYLLQFSMVGYETKISGPFYLSNDTTVTQPVQILKAVAGNLTGVSIVAQKSLAQIETGKTVYNVESSINSTGSTALEILEKTSGLQVDNSDNISLKGKDGVRIYINGREMPLDNKSLIAYLNTLSSSDIKSIEEISNPDARYDAAGSAGIIIIRLKKNQIYGANGDVSLNYIQGITPKGNAALNLNYRNKKLNVFGSLSGSLGQSQTQFNLYRIQLDTLYDQRTVYHNHNNGFTIKTGLDYTINDKNIIGVMANYAYANALYTSVANTPVYSNSGEFLVHKIRSLDHAPGNIVNDNFNINYRYADTLGTEINFDANYGYFSHPSNGYLPNYYYDQQGNFLYSIINWNAAPTSIDIYTAKLDILQNLWKGKIGYGVKTSFIHTDNAYIFFDQDPNNQPVLEVDASSHFLYKENINAAYLNYQRPFEKWNVTAGLRVEQTKSDGEQFKADNNELKTSLKRNYVGLFPGISISWKATENHAFTVSYSRRIDRPVYQDLNPFEQKLDEFTYFRGNEFLQPQNTNQITFSDMIHKRVSASLFYSNTSDLAKRVSDTVKNQIYAQVRNIGTQKTVGLNIAASFRIAKWWQSFQSLWYNYQMFDVIVDGIAVKSDIPAIGVNTSQSFSFKKGYAAELTAWCNGPNSDNAIWKIRTMGGVDIGVKKALMNNELTIKLSATDIFHTNQLRVHGKFQGVVGIGSLVPETQTVRLGVFWRFGSSKIKGIRERKTGLESETQRIKIQ